MKARAPPSSMLPENGGKQVPKSHQVPRFAGSRALPYPSLGTWHMPGSGFQPGIPPWAHGIRAGRQLEGRSRCTRIGSELQHPDVHSPCVPSALGDPCSSPSPTKKCDLLAPVLRTSHSPGTCWFRLEMTKRKEKTHRKYFSFKIIFCF